MARFKIEATWDDTDGIPVVKLEYDRLDPIDPDHFAHLVSAGSMKADDEPQGWTVLDSETVTELTLLTPKRIRRHALHWLTEHAHMGSDDSFEFYTWISADRHALERIEAAVAS